MSRLVESYKGYLGWGQLVDVALVGILTFVLNEGIQFFIFGVIVIHVVGFIIHYKNLDDRGAENPMIDKVQEVN